MRQRGFVLASLGPAVSAPDFGPQSPPDANRSERVVKDILRVGKWKVGYDDRGNPTYWDVTPQVLSQIVNDFNAMKANGVEPNLGKTHGDDNLLIHPDDLIAPIDELRIDGDTLWMASYVTPEEKRYLENPARKVSVGVIPNHADGTGKTYKLYLTHVAVTDRPVVAGQAPFMALADAGGGSMDFAALVEAINGLLEANGMGKLPEDVTEVNIVDVLKGVQTAMGKTAPAETETPEMPAEPGLDMAGLPPAMADLIRKQNDQIKQLSDRVAAADAEKVQIQRAAFAAKAADLQTAGVAKSVIDGKIALADRLKCYDVALLDGLKPTLNVGGGVARKLADGTPAQGATVSEDDRKKEIAADIAKRRGIKLEDAMKLVP